MGNGDVPHVGQCVRGSRSDHGKEPGEGGKVEHSKLMAQGSLIVRTESQCRGALQAEKEGPGSEDG